MTGAAHDSETDLRDGGRTRGAKRAHSGAHRRVAFAAGSVVALMLGAAYAAVPIYRLICQVTGMGGTTQRADRAPGAVSDKTVRVRLNGNVQSGLPWRFAPERTVVEVHFGATTLAHYRAENVASAATVGSATFNVTPEIAGRYFSKIECFCFTEQRLEAGQQVEMPVTFFVDPAMLEDKDAMGVEEITLSYTFFAVPQPKAGLARSESTGDARPRPTSGTGSIE